MKGLKFKAYVAVVEDSTIKYVTKLGSGHMAFWEKEKPAMAMPLSNAKDIAWGLCVNGFRAIVVQALDGLEFRNM